MWRLRISRGKRLLIGALIFLGSLAICILGFIQFWMRPRIAPPDNSASVLVRFESPVSLQTALSFIEREGGIRDANMMMLYARYKRTPRLVKAGTYEIGPHAEADAVLAALQVPVRQMVRLPEGWWIARTAKVLEQNRVCPADDFTKLAANPNAFTISGEFKLPPDRTLEGYLFPDTYDLPPLLGAKGVIERQLRTFKEKVFPVLPAGTDVDRCVIIGSMIEAEVAFDSERPLVASVIENRLRVGMPLQIDATVLYALGEWRVLGPGEVRKVDSQYNTYLHKGLPPGPICSPSAASILAAAKPAKTNYLYYVARPDRTHYFATDYASHLANIRRARAEAKGP